MALRYVQILDALDYGDAVSNQVIHIHQMLINKGEKSQIFSKFADHRVDKYRLNFAEFCIDEDTVILHHFCGYSEIADEITNLRGYKIMIYHNITPHSFFDPKSALYEFCKQGREQLQNIVGKYNLILGDSPFNCQEAKDLGATVVKELPIIVPKFSTEVSVNSVNNLRFGLDHVWLFVGRITPNKRQDLLIDILARYIKLYPDQKNHLYLVGRYFEDDVYYQQLRSKIERLGLNKQVTLVGKVEDEDLPAYYQAADLFICMSEHEGFCVPIVEAFNNQVPVVAYAGTAVSYTMGGGVGALESLDVETAVRRIHSVFTAHSLKNELVDHGIKQAHRFSPDAVRQHLYAIIDEITHEDGQKDTLLVSVVICTCDRSDYLKRCLDYLYDQDYRHFEVIVVNGPSTDNTQEILTLRDNIKVVQNPLRNLSVSRNLGIRYASGDIVAFIDDDALPYDNWLFEIVKRYRELPRNVVGIGGRTFLANQFKFQFELGIIDSFGNHVEVAAHETQKNNGKYYRHLLGTNCSFRKDALIAVNGFDEQYEYYLDESDLAVRLQQVGGVIANANQAYIRHEFAQSHNRQGKYNFNWQVIAKNTVYFGVKNADKNSYWLTRIWKINQHLLQERCLNFIKAWWHDDLQLQAAIAYSFRTIIGALRGYYDSCFPRRVGKNLSDINSPFLPYMQNNHSERTKQQLHILIISQEFPPHSFGGIGAYNQTLARELMQMGHEVTVISRGPRDCTDVIGPLTQIQVGFVENYHYIPESPMLSKNIAWAEKVAQIVQQIHCQHPISVVESALWDFEGIGVVMLRPELKVPLIVRLVTPLAIAIQMNGWRMNEDLKRCMQMEQELIRCADQVIAISKNIQDTVVSSYNLTPDHRWLVQPLGVQPWPAYTNITNYGELPKDLKRGAIQILFVGRLESRKGIDVFINALKLVMPKEPSISVWIAGSDIEGWKEKAGRILRGDIYSRVQFLGMVSEEKLQLLYANCDFLVFPSRYESFGLVPLEAMVHGKPVIAARVGAIPEVVLEGECGLLFEPDNYQELAQKILNILHDDHLRDQLAKGAKQRVEVLSARNMAKASVNVYQSLVNAKTPMQTISPQIREIFSNHLLSTESNLKSNVEITNHPAEKSLLRQSDYLNMRPDWSLTQPQIISWGWLNSIINRLIVPKIVKFINSVLYESMQRQTYMNNALISSNKALANELINLRKNTVKETMLDSQMGVENILGAIQKSVEEVKQGMNNQLSEIVELKQLVYETKNLMIPECERSRSEFAYRLKFHQGQAPIIISKEKVKANLHDLHLNLGCGQVIIPDYINVDQRELPGVDVIANISNLPFEQGTVAEIYNSHVIEHFTEYEVTNHILPYWYSMLKNSGKMVIICPDAKSMMIDYANGHFPWENLRKVTYGCQDYGGNHHFNMYTSESLCKILLNCGFSEVNIVDIKRVNGLCYEMEIHALK